MYANPNIRGAEAAFKKGCDFFSKSNFQGAISQFSIAINEVPKASNAWAMRGRVHYSLSNYNASISDYTVAINIDPKVGDFYYFRAFAYASLGNANAALNDIRTAASLGHVDAKNQLAIYEAQQATMRAQQEADRKKTREFVNQTIQERFPGIKLS